MKERTKEVKEKAWTERSWGEGNNSVIENP